MVSIKTTAQIFDDDEIETLYGLFRKVREYCLNRDSVCSQCPLQEYHCDYCYVCSLSDYVYEEHRRILKEREYDESFAEDLKRAELEDARS